MHNSSLIQTGYSQSNRHKGDSEITGSNISYILIKPQPLPCTLACGYQYDVLAVYPPPTPTQIYSTSIWIRISNPVGCLRWSFFCRNSQRVRPVGCFRRGASSLVSDAIRNVTQSEEFSTTRVTQEYLELPRPPNSLESHQTQKQ